jgi:hypothetical protein
MAIRQGSEILFSGKGSLFISDDVNNWIVVAYAGSFSIEGSIDYVKATRSYDYIADRSIKTKEEYKLKFNTRNYILPAMFKLMGYDGLSGKQYKGLIKSVNFDNIGVATITTTEFNGSQIEAVLILIEDDTYKFSWYQSNNFALAGNTLTITESTFANKKARVHVVYSKNNAQLVAHSTTERESKVLLNTQLDQTNKAISIYVPRVKLTKPLGFKGLGEPFQDVDLEFEVLLDEFGKPFYIGEIFSWINE